MDKTLAEILVNEIEALSVRATRAEEERALFLNGCDRRDKEIAGLKSENDALKKQIQNLEAKLASFEGLQEADRGLL